MTPQEREQQLSQYWHHTLDALQAPPALAERALGKARRAGPPSHTLVGGQGFWRPVTRAFVAVLSVLALTGTGFFLTRPHSLLNADSRTLHTRPQLAASTGSVAGAAKSVKLAPPMRLAALTQSTGPKLWALDYAQGFWQLWDKSLSGSAWSLVRTASGPPSVHAVLSFSQQEGWLVLPRLGGGWKAWRTRDNGRTWRPVLLPHAAATYGTVVLSNASQAVYLAVGGRSGAPPLLFQKKTRGWVEIPANRLPADLADLRLTPQGQGSLLAHGSVYVTRNGGRDWSIQPGAFNGVMTSARPTALSPLMPPTALAIRTASLEGLESSVRGRTWVVVGNYLWTTKFSHRTWQRVGRVPTQGVAHGLIFTTVKTGYILSNVGHVYITHDGGYRWARYHD